MFESITEIKQANAARGFHFFDRDTLRFFASRISTTVYPTPNGAYFVTSEKSGFDDPTRTYTVRFCSSAKPRRGEIHTVGNGFNGYASRSGAHKAAQRLAADANRNATKSK